MMSCRVKLFAVAQQLAGCRELTLELRDGATVAELRAGLAAQVPALAPLLPQMLFAVDAEYVQDETPLRAEADIACIPPVSGG